MGVFRCKATFYSIPLLSCVRESGSCSNGAADLTRKYYSYIKLMRPVYYSRCANPCFISKFDDNLSFWVVQSQVKRVPAGEEPRVSPPSALALLRRTGERGILALCAR